jgi:hypothetical protein
MFLSFIFFADDEKVFWAIKFPQGGSSLQMTPYVAGAQRTK